MKRTSTQTPTLQQAKHREPRPSVSKSTIAFLRQFARAYQYQPQLHPALGGYIAN